MFLYGDVMTATEAAKNLKAEGTTVSPDTIRRFLKKGNFNASIKKDSLPLTAARKKTRLAWAKKYRSWTVDDWKRVIFSDETKINRLGSDGRRWTWVKKGEALRDHNVNHAYKHGGGNLKLWSCISAHGPGYITKIEGSMNSDLYIQIIDEDYRASLEEFNVDSENVIFQQDNDPKHTSKKTEKWLKENNIQVLDWPPYSPDMNPIENAWYYLKSKLGQYERAPTSINELWERVADVWYNQVTKEYCVKLIEGMPKRIEAVIKAKGGATKW
jgi:transposase